MEIGNNYKSGCNAPGRKEFVMMENQLAKVIAENGVTYHLAEDDCYYPQLSLEQKTDYTIGKYGIMCGEYMMKYQRHEYLKMVMDGTWNQYLHDVDEECHREVELAVKRIMEKEGVTEQLKNENPLKWVQRVNGIKARVEEVMQKM
ncbi:TnpV protein [Roseburia sp. 1XD42-69]|nr:TnpV protein [Roseburia sp. 1XD42-69]